MAAILQSQYLNAFFSVNKFWFNTLKFVPKGTIDNMSALVWIMAWRQRGETPLSEPVVALFTDTYMRRSATMSFIYACFSWDSCLNPLARYGHDGPVHNHNKIQGLNHVNNLHTYYLIICRICTHLSTSVIQNILPTWNEWKTILSKPWEVSEINCYFLFFFYR